MSREKITRQMIEYLEKQLNCENVMRFADEKAIDKHATKKLMVKDIPLAFDIVNYDDTEGYVQETPSDKRDQASVRAMYGRFDYMTEANFTGFEYFPYLYGVLDCHGGADSRVYLFYEYFIGNLVDLVINNIEHPSEWYDIAFQLITLNHYILNVTNKRYHSAVPQNHLYRKLDKPYYKEYQFNNTKLKINHKYLIVLWDFDFGPGPSNIELLLQYLEKNKDKIKIPPTPRVIKLLTEVKNNPSDTINILTVYYAQN